MSRRSPPPVRDGGQRYPLTGIPNGFITRCEAGGELGRGGGGCRALSNAEPSQSIPVALDPGSSSHTHTRSMSAVGTLDPLAPHPNTQGCCSLAGGTYKHRRATAADPPQRPGGGLEKGFGGAQPTPRSPPPCSVGLRDRFRARLPGAGCHKREPLGWRNSSQSCFTALHPQSL